MTPTEMAVVTGGALLGYWIVSSLTATKADKKNKGDPVPDASWNAERQTDPPHEEALISSSWFRILEVPETASREEIVSAYKLKIRQYHPDKVASLGLELRELAELKSKQINAAYDYALKLRG
jgi:DnaJ-domain-containing protein 1